LQRQGDSIELSLQVRSELELQVDLALLAPDRHLLLLNQTPLLFKLRAHRVPDSHVASFRRRLDESLARRT